MYLVWLSCTDMRTYTCQLIGLLPSVGGGEAGVGGS